MGTFSGSPGRAEASGGGEVPPRRLHIGAFALLPDFFVIYKSTFKRHCGKNDA